VVLLTLPAGAATPTRRLLAVELRSEADAPWFAIRTDTPANFTSFKLRHPTRIVVDFPETTALDAAGARPDAGLVSGWSMQKMGTREQVVARLTVELRGDADYTLSSEGSEVELHLVPATARPLVALESHVIDQPSSPATASTKDEVPLLPPEPVAAPTPVTPTPAPAPAPVTPAPVGPPVPVQEATPGLKTDAPHPATSDQESQEERARKRQTEESRALAEQQAAKDREAAEQQAVKEREAAEQRQLAERRAREASEAAEQRVLAEQKAAAERKAAEQRALAEQKAAAEREAAEQRALAEQKAAAEREAAEQRALAEQKAAAEREAVEQRALAEQKAVAERKAAEQRALAEQKAAAEREAAEQRAHEAEVRRQRQAEEETRALPGKKAREEQLHAEPAAPPAPLERIVTAKRNGVPVLGRLEPARRAAPAVLGQIGFHAAEGGPEIIIHTSSPVTYEMREASAERLYLDLDRTGITVANNRRPLETRFFGTNVSRIVPHEDRAQQRVSVEIDLATPAPYDIQADGATLRVRFHALPVTTAVARGLDPTPEP
jgi:hypothetical protein